MSADLSSPGTAARRWPISSIVLLAANVAPVIGVLTGHWTVFPVVLLYWCENVMVGVFNVLRMLCARPQDPMTLAGKFFLIPFFCVHYGGFASVHGIFVFSLFGGSHGLAQGSSPLSVHGFLTALRQAGIGWPVAALFASHGFSFFHNYLGAGEYKRVGLSQLMTQPYARVMVLHIVIIGGGILAQALGSALPALLLLIALKTLIDLGAHLAERRRLGTLPPGQAVFATTSS